MTEREHRPWCDRVTHDLTEREMALWALGCSSELIEVVSLHGTVLTDSDGQDVVKIALKDEVLVLPILEAAELHPQFLGRALATYKAKAPR